MVDVGNWVYIVDEVILQYSFNLSRICILTIPYNDVGRTNFPYTYVIRYLINFINNSKSSVLQQGKVVDYLFSEEYVIRYMLYVYLYQYALPSGPVHLNNYFLTWYLKILSYV